MLSIKIEGKEIDLPNGFSITMNGKSPIFNDIGDYSYPVKANYTDKNASVFNFLNRVQNTSDPYKESSCEILNDDLIIISGLMKAKIGNQGGYEFQIFPNESNFYSIIKKLRLTQIDYGSEHMAISVDHLVGIANSYINRYYPDVNYGFPQIQDESYFDPPPDDPGLNFINHYERRGDESIFQLHTWTGDLESHYSVIIPMLYYRYVLDCIYKRLGYNYIDEFFSRNQLFNKMVIANAKNSHVYGGDEETYMRLNRHVPDIPLNDFFLGQERYFNVRNFVNQTTKTVKLKSVDEILFNPDYVDLSDKTLSVSVELEDFISGFLLKMELDDKDSSLARSSQVQDDFMKLFTGCANTLLELPGYPETPVDTIFLVLSEMKFYQFTNDLVWIQYYHPYINDNLISQMLNGNINGSQEVTTSFSALMNNFLLAGFSFGDPVGYGYLNTDWKEIKTRLCFNLFKPSVPHGGAMIAYSDVPGDLSLVYCGNNNVYELNFRRFFDWMRGTKQVKITCIMSFLDLRDIDFSMKYRINGTNYLLKDYQVTLKTNEISPVTFTAYVCP